MGQPEEGPTQTPAGRLRPIAMAQPPEVRIASNRVARMLRDFQPPARSVQGVVAGSGPLCGSATIQTALGRPCS